MTTLQKSIVAVVLIAAVGAALYQTQQVSRLRAEIQAVRQGQEQQLTLSNQVQALQRERDRATNALAAIAEENAALKKSPPDVMKLRGEVGRLRQENTAMGSSSPLSKVTANEGARKLLRDTQKAGMGMIYKGYAQNLKLSSEQTDKLNDMLADHIMQNVDNVTLALRDKLPLDRVDGLFATQETALQREIENLVGADGMTQYQDYTRNLLASLTTDQFKGMLSGTDAEKEQKAQQFRQLLETETRTALANAGLPPDFQAVPILNFRNIASEQAGEQGIKLLDTIYQQAADHGSSFLSAEDLKKFNEFRGTAINNSRSALTLNRTMMAPIGQ